MSKRSLDLSPRQRATHDDLRSVYALLEEATAWLAATGVAQWPRVYPLDRFARDVEAGCVWFWMAGRRVVATATLFRDRPDYYPAGIWEDSASAWYICRLAVARWAAGSSVGPRILGEINEAAAVAGVEALRLDVVASNPFLERYYLARGFGRVGAAEIMGEGSVFLAKSVEPR